jgi:hypothetical protein
MDMKEEEMEHIIVLLCGTEDDQKDAVNLLNSARAETLNLTRTKFTDSGLKSLSTVTTLIRLDLSNTAISDSSLDSLSELENLCFLDIGNTKISDAGIEYLTLLENLDELRLGSTQITDTGIEHVSMMNNLLSLDINNCKITDKGLSCLVGLKKLISLNLSKTLITDRGIENLVDLISLKELKLNETKITDSSVEFLSELRNVGILDVEYTSITHDGLGRLKNRLVGCGIQRRIEDEDKTEITDKDVKKGIDIVLQDACELMTQDERFGDIFSIIRDSNLSLEVYLEVSGDSIPTWFQKIGCFKHDGFEGISSHDENYDRFNISPDFPTELRPICQEVIDVFNDSFSECKYFPLSMHEKAMLDATPRKAGKAVENPLVNGLRIRKYRRPKSLRIHNEFGLRKARRAIYYWEEETDNLHYVQIIATCENLNRKLRTPLLGFDVDEMDVQYLHKDIPEVIDEKDTTIRDIEEREWFQCLSEESKITVKTAESLYENLIVKPSVISDSSELDLSVIFLLYLKSIEIELNGFFRNYEKEIIKTIQNVEKKDPGYFTKSGTLRDVKKQVDDAINKTFYSIAGRFLYLIIYRLGMGIGFPENVVGFLPFELQRKKENEKEVLRLSDELFRRRSGTAHTQIMCDPEEIKDLREKCHKVIAFIVSLKLE